MNKVNAKWAIITARRRFRDECRAVKKAILESPYAAMMQQNMEYDRVIGEQMKAKPH